MLIKRTSMATGVTRELDIPVTQEQVDGRMDGAMVQYAFPSLTAGQREFLMTGITDEEWEEIFPEE